jgi:hypothetical protein
MLMKPADSPASTDKDDQARWEAATRVHRDHPRWVVTWPAMRAEFQARPLFRARGTVITGATPEQLTSRMNTVELAASRSGGPVRTKQYVAQPRQAPIGDSVMPACPGASSEPLSTGPALRLADSDGEAVPSSRPDPDRPLGEVPAPVTVLDQQSFESGIPNIARVYGYWLGGKDHYEADRKAAEAVIRLRPQVVAGARANRAFLARVVRFLAADCGIRQFLDIGCGLPATDNTHEVAQQVAPGCRVVYADNDPVVLSHARALLTSTPQGTCDYLDADVRDTAAILTGAARTLDLARPVAVLLLAVLHFIDSDDPTEIVAALAGALARGSFIAISHLTADSAPEQVGAAVTAYNTLASVPVQPRTHSQVTGLLGGLPLLAPGVVPVGQWRPSIGEVPQPCDLYGGLARVPRGRR